MQNFNLKSKILIILFIVLGIFFFAKDSLAANHYIRAGATGLNNGTSWTNAWTTFGAISTANWIRGDTYYVAGGDYAGDILVSKITPTNGWIIIKKANAVDNGAEADWNPAYATTQAVIKGRVTLEYGNIEMDGVAGSGESGHGIKIWIETFGHVTPFDVGIRLDNDGNAYSFHLHHLEVMGASPVTSTNSQSGIYAFKVSGAGKGLHISDSWIHNWSLMGLILGSTVGTSYSDYGMLFENNVMSEVGACTGPDHGQGVQIGPSIPVAYHIYRNNIFRNIAGSAFIAYLGGVTTSEQRIYNNVFYDTDPAAYNTVSPGVIWLSEAVGGSANGVYIYNNTFHDIGNPSYTNIKAQVWFSTGTNIELKNNIWTGSNFTAGHYGITSILNNGYYANTGAGAPTATESADPFTNSAAYNFNLKSTANAVNNGLDLSSIFTTDIVGTSRPQGSAWDIGAYEYVSVAPPPDTTPPAAPTGVVVQ